MKASGDRDSVFLEDAEILAHHAYPGEQYVMRLNAPTCATHARPGSFVHLQCDPLLPLRRPLSIMRASAAEGWIEILYKAVGQGTRLLAKREVGESVSTLGPIGRVFEAHERFTRPLLIGGGVGMPPMIQLAESLSTQPAFRPLVLLGSESPFPFDPRPSRILVSDLPSDVIACMPLLDDWRIPSRLASLQGFPGCFEGFVTELARIWLAALDDSALDEVELFACGPHPMLEATARLARDFNLPCQLSLEEYMACGVGGCAGCVVEIQREGQRMMKRVCVDGPVFDAGEVFF